MIDVGLQIMGPFFDLFTNPSSRTHWIGLLVFSVVFVLWYGRTASIEYVKHCVKQKSIHLDVQLLVFNRMIRVLWVGLAAHLTWKIAVETTGVFRDIFSENPVELSTASTIFLYSCVLFIMDDVSRFTLHRALHKLPVLWRFHQVHHSATELTPLTFFRIHPVESILYQIRAVVVTGGVAGACYWFCGKGVGPLEVLGVPAVGFVLNTLFGNFRHSNVFLRFPQSVERWFLSPAQHQLHHSVEQEHWNRNFGTWLAIWDRLSGSLLVSKTKPLGFGLASPNHEQGLISALLLPFAFKEHVMKPVVMTGLLMFSALGYADEPTDEESENEESSTETDRNDGPQGSAQIIVYGDNQRIKEAGAAHQVSEEVLEQFEWNDIQRVLSFVPGVMTRTEDGFGLRPNIGIRGANSDRSAKVTLMEDGVLFAPAPYAAPAAYYFPMTTRLVGVEVFKGAASTRYGPQTVGGAVNVLTRSIPTTKEWSGDISYGAFNTLKFHGYSGGQVGQWGVLIEGTHLQSDGFKELASNAPTGFARTESMVKLRRNSAQHTVQVKLGHAREKSNETYLGLSQSDFEKTPLLRYPASQEGLMEWDRTQAEILWAVRPSPSWEIQTVAYHHYLERSWRKFNRFANRIDVHNLLQQDPTGGEGALYLSILRGESDALLPEEYLQIGINARKFHSFGVQSASVWESVGETQSHRVEIGARVHGDLVHRNHTERSAQMIAQEIVYVEDSNLQLLDSQVGAMALALYAYDDWSIGKLHLFPSLRNETIQTTTNIDGWKDPILRSILLPGMGTMWEFDDWLDIFASAHKGFSPVAPEQESAVLPEVAWNYELGLRQNFDDTKAEFIVFLNDYKRIAGQCTLSSGCDVNDLGRQFTGGQALITGLETLVASEYWLQNGWSIPAQIQYTFTHAEFTENFYSGFSQFGSVATGDRLPYVAAHQGTLSTGLKTEKVSINGVTNYRGQMLDKAGTSESATVIPRLWTADISGSVRVVDNWIVYGTWNNVTNTQAVTSWRPFGARPITPSSLFLGVKRDI